MTDMKDGKKEKTGILDVLFRRGGRDCRISGDHRGDIEAPGGVNVEASAFVEGNVKASRVDVAGTVLGTIIARQLNVVAGGRIWGDVLAERIHVEPGGALSGWVVTLTESEMHGLLSEDLALSEWPATERLQEAQAHFAPPLPQPEHNAGMPETQIALLRKIQMEAGRVLSAYQALEREFEERLESAAGDVIARANTLENELSTVRGRVSTLQERLGSLQSTSERRAAELKETQERLAEEQGLLEQREEALEELRARDEGHQRNLSQSEERNERLREQLDKIARYAASSSHRVESLENALQATIQQTSEQQDVLIHWQELARATQEEVAKLEEELAESRQKLERSQEEVRELTRLRAERERGREQSRTESAGDTRRSAETVPAVTEDQAPAGIDAVPLDAEQATVQGQLQEQDDQILWYRTALSATREQLQDVRAKLMEKEEQLEAVRSELAQQERLGKKWQGRVGRMSEMLYEVSRQMKEKEELLQRVREEKEAAPSQANSFEDSALRQLLRERDMQLEALEAEVEQYRQDLQAQSQRLAETRSDLAEIHVQLQDAKAGADQQQMALREVRRRAGGRIRELEQDLEEARDQKSGEGDPADAAPS